MRALDCDPSTLFRGNPRRSPGILLSSLPVPKRPYSSTTTVFVDFIRASRPLAINPSISLRKAVSHRRNVLQRGDDSLTPLFLIALNSIQALNNLSLTFQLLFPDPRTKTTKVHLRIRSELCCGRIVHAYIPVLRLNIGSSSCNCGIFPSGIGGSSILKVSFYQNNHPSHGFLIFYFCPPTVPILWTLTHAQQQPCADTGRLQS